MRDVCPRAVVELYMRSKTREYLEISRVEVALVETALKKVEAVSLLQLDTELSNTGFIHVSIWNHLVQTPVNALTMRRKCVDST